MDTKEQFLKLYNQIFDEEGKISNCGRDLCKEIIVLANTIDAIQNRDYGNSLTGFMNTENIHKLYKELS